MIAIPLDRRVHAAFKRSVGVQPSEPPWDCTRGMHEPVWVKFLGEFRCGGCFRRLGVQNGRY